MTKDIVERARKIAESHDGLGIVSELADEITKLRAENETLRKGTLDGLDIDGVVGLQQQNDDLRAERDAAAAAERKRCAEIARRYIGASSGIDTAEAIATVIESQET